MIKEEIKTLKEIIRWFEQDRDHFREAFTKIKCILKAILKKLEMTDLVEIASYI